MLGAADDARSGTPNWSNVPSMVPNVTPCLILLLASSKLQLVINYWVSLTRWLVGVKIINSGSGL